jgi:putative 4-mercaptohistidine N1-methyltranferase
MNPFFAILAKQPNAHRVGCMDNASYESNLLLCQYLLFHYGSSDQQLPWKAGPREALAFPVRCVQEGVDLNRLPARRRALDVGCAVGRATFELGRIFESVTGIDYSHAFVDAANRIAEAGSLSYQYQETGTILAEAVAEHPDGVGGKVAFSQGDAQDLPADLGRFDCVLAANLLCRLGQPDRFLERLPDLLEPSGQLIITTPNTWLESFTAREFWLGATPETGEPLEALKERLQSDFELDTVWDMPFLIREHQRKYQWSVAQASRWIKRS